MKRRAILLALAFSGACYGSQMSSCETGGGPTPIPPTPTPTATPSPTPAPSPSPTKDPCNPVTGLLASGPAEVRLGQVIAFDLTPTTPDGRLEGRLDFCNANRFPEVARASVNLRCVGECGGWRPQFLAVALGPFEVQFKLGTVYSLTHAGTVVR